MRERALIFANGDPNDGPMVRRALAHAPDALIVAADGGARVAQHFQLPIHAVIGDMDSLGAAEVEALAATGTLIERAPTDKNETDLELALLWAVAQGARWLRIIGALGDRLDQTLGNVHLLALPSLAGCDVRLVAGKQAAWLARPGCTDIDGAVGDTLSLLPLSDTVQGVRTERLKYPLNDEPLIFGPARGISNVMLAESAQVCLRAGLLLIVQTRGRA
ncbi:MAG: thiamine diphosphokinase [Chloroflexi bacterium]|nr:thiamine diphosphokinase [Chloroflexota bacterium]